MLSHQLTDNVKLLQKIVLLVGDQFLILKRAGDAHTRARQWDLPGGNSEWPNDTPKIAKDSHLNDLLREVAEETGVNLDLNRISPLPIYFGTYFESSKQVYTIIVGWQARLPAKPPITLSSEHTELAWITLAQFDDYDFGFAGAPNGFIRQTLRFM